ncbi:MAG: LamB/YcsF family protein [Alphaproteobacteria bacterium]|nr:LamB/YcsF family protein [Alphaproteobacteria bacterium]
MTRIDLNCDLGEGFGRWEIGNDAAMLELASSVNIACGFHAGDPDIMRRTVEQARERNVAIGAHPGYRDLHGFGRHRISGLTASQIENLVAYQIGALQAIATAAGHTVTHIKPHGALSNVACSDAMTARAIARAVRAVDRSLVFVVLPASELVRAGEDAGLQLAHEVFADRAYEDDFTLVARDRPQAVLTDADAIATRVLRMVEDGALIAASGRRLTTPIDTICIHGDSEHAVAIAAAIRHTLDVNGITVAPFVTPAR